MCGRRSLWGLHCGDSCQALSGGGAERPREQAYGKGGLMGGAATEGEMAVRMDMGG